MNDSFDIVFSRLAFHHFTDVSTAFSEIEDEIETLRDISHVRNMSREKMISLFIANSLSIQNCETTEIRQKLQLIHISCRVYVVLPFKIGTFSHKTAHI